MKAWIVEQHGEPQDVLQWADVAEPSSGPGLLKVRVRAAALNFSDVLLCQGKYQAKPSFPFTPGMEIAGEVVEVGPDVSAWKPGDLVFGPPHSEAGAGGGFAESTLMRADKAFALPAGMPPEEAAGFAVTYQTSWIALHTRAGIREGDVVLVHAGAGGAGSSAIQIAKAAGATVIATAGGADKKDLLREIGADIAVDYRAEDFVQVVKDATDGRGADIVYDPVGGDTYDRSTKCIAFEGRILIIGFAGGRIAQAATNHVMVKNYSVVGVHLGHYEKSRPEVIAQADRELARLYEAGLLAPMVSRVYPMPELPKALDALSSRKTTGKVVVVP